jgi:hypothetical protein
MRLIWNLYSCVYRVLRVGRAITNAVCMCIWGISTKWIERIKPEDEYFDSRCLVGLNIAYA